MLCLFAGNVQSSAEPTQWERVEAKGQPHARHEAAFVECAGRFFLLGGRGIKPVDIYDPKTDAWSEGAEIPKDRRRGGAGAVISDGKLYLVSGIQNGHWDGWVTWLDAFDLKKGTWMKLPDAPRARDHFQTAVIDGKLYAVGGRKTSGVTKQVFDLTIPEVDVFDLAKGKWTTLDHRQNLPTPRAGNSAFVLGHDLIIAGGESMAQKLAHNELQALNTRTGKWRNLPGLIQGRHGTGLILWDGALYTCAGSGGRGGRPELDTMESLPLNKL